MGSDGNFSNVSSYFMIGSGALIILICIVLKILNEKKTLYDGVKAFGASTMKKGDTMAKMYFESIAKHYGVKIKDVPIKKLPKDFLNKILYGTGTEEIDFEYQSAAGTRKFTAPFEGVIPTLDRRYRETKSQGMRDFYEMYMSNSHCDYSR